LLLVAASMFITRPTAACRLIPLWWAGTAAPEGPSSVLTHRRTLGYALKLKRKGIAVVT
jgi:hypothetical protein